MSDIQLQEDVSIIYQENNRYRILSENGTYKPFKGLAVGTSADYLYEVDGFLYTKTHQFVIDGKTVTAEEIGKKTNIKETVYDVLDVEDTHTYWSNDKIHRNCLLLDEFAFLGNGKNSDLAEEFISSVFPTISSAKIKKNSKIIIISTPNGMNAFYRIYHKATIGLNDFIPFKIDWRTIPRAVPPEEFKRNQINILGAEKFEQEYECVAGDTNITLRNEETGEVITLTLEEAEKLLQEAAKTVSKE